MCQAELANWRNAIEIRAGLPRVCRPSRHIKREGRALSAALAGNGCGCFVPDLTRLTMPQCAGARRPAFYQHSLLCFEGFVDGCDDSAAGPAGATHAEAGAAPGVSPVSSSGFQNPNCCQIWSTRAFTSASMAIVVPHSRSVSPGHLLVASMPILLPSPLTGDAKSR